MLSFFRRLVNSKVGIVVTLGILGLIALAFAMGDVTGLRHSGTTGLTGDVVATVGGKKITATELREQAMREMENYRQRQPGLDVAQFVAGGGVDAALDRMIDSAAYDKFAAQQGMVVSKKSVDGQIAAEPAFAGPDGKFSQQTYDRLLGQIKLTDAAVHDEIRQQIIAKHLIVPTIGASQVPLQMATPYASLLLEHRDGQIGFIPSIGVGPKTPPTDAELTAFYQRNGMRYRVPERRAIRYALVTPATVAAEATPSDAEVARAYQAQRASFAPTEKRTLVQVVAADQATAAKLAAAVKGGTPIDTAARAAGLEPATLALDKAGYAAQSSADIANAAFGAAKGAVLGPLRAPLGFLIVKVDAIIQVPGKTLDQAKPDLVKALTMSKTIAVLTTKRNAVDDAVGNKSNFDELVAAQKLSAQRTTALLPNGIDPENPTAKPDPALGPLLAAGFTAEQGDDPQTVPLGQDGSFALVALDKIVPAAPRPLPAIREAVVQDFLLDRGSRAARQVAAAVTTAVGKGTPLAQALTATGLKLPPVKQLSAPRAQLAANPQGAPPPMVLMFNMTAKTAKLLEAPNKAGWFVIYLDRIQPGDARNQPGVLTGVRSDLGKVIGREYTEQFSKAVRKLVGFEKNAKTLAALKASMLGAEVSDQP